MSKLRSLTRPTLNVLICAFSLSLFAGCAADVSGGGGTETQCPATFVEGASCTGPAGVCWTACVNGYKSEFSCDGGNWGAGKGVFLCGDAGAGQPRDAGARPPLDGSARQPGDAGARPPLDASGNDGGDAGAGNSGSVFAKLDDQPLALTVSGSRLYVAETFDGLLSFPLAGGSATSLVGSAEAGVVFESFFSSDSAYLYFSESSGGDTSGPIARVSIDGGAVTVLAHSVGFTAGLAIDGTFLYWVNQDTGTIERVPLAGGAASVVAGHLTGPGGLAVGGGTLYFMDTAGDLLSVPVTGGTVTTLAKGPGVPSNTIVADWSPSVVIDDENIYFSVCSYDDSTPSSLFRVARAGGPAASLASSCARGIAVDATAVYWASSDGTVNVVPRLGGPSRVVARPVNLTAGPALDATNVYWGVSRESGGCGLCSPRPPGQNAIMFAPKPSTP